LCAGHERIIVGDPDQCAEEVKRYDEEFEVPFMFFRAYWPVWNLSKPSMLFDFSDRK
jgi:hypothetical protein